MGARWWWGRKGDGIVTNSQSGENSLWSGLVRSGEFRNTFPFLCVAAGTLNLLSPSILEGASPTIYVAQL